MAVLKATSANELIEGTEFDDKIYGYRGNNTSSNNILLGNGGNDTLIGGTNGTSFEGGSGNDSILGSECVNDFATPGIINLQSNAVCWVSPVLED